jgi:hypothetical protein
MVAAVASRGGSHAGVSGSAGAASPLIERLRLGSLWMVGAISGFVMIEPAPYEFMIMLSALVFVATGLMLRAGHLPLVLMLIVYNIGFATSLVPVIELPDTAKWTAVSCFLSLTTLFFAVALAEDTVRRTDVLMRGYILCAVITSIIAVLAYFKLIPGWETFIFALRARSTFKDPNVFGPFLILPALIVLQRIMFGGLRDAMVNGVVALIIAAGLFLSFSRGAWGHFAASAAIMLFFTYITTRSATDRLRIVVFAVMAALAIAAFIVALLSMDAVANLFKERASLVQNYDAGHLGRFAQLIPRRLHGRRLARRFHVLRAGAGDGRHRLSPRVYALALAADLHRGLCGFSGRGRRELHHRRPALAPLLPDHGNGVGPAGGRPRGAAGGLRSAGLRPRAGGRLAGCLSVRAHYSPPHFGA